jgi:nicotinate-nucleotide pyrophosphorylase (carboxylating)
MSQKFDLNAFIDRALEEDIRDGDHTSLSTVGEEDWGSAILKVKDDGTLAGMQVAKAVFHRFDSSLHLEQYLADGDPVRQGQEAFKVTGKIRSILSTERLVLNLMQRMSGIASTTAAYSEKISHTKAKVLDTRKTTPLLRWFEKEAVRIGGGTNHRFGLYDMIMIKDNHVDAAGSIENALNRTHDYLTINSLDLKIEIEVRSLDELEQAIKHGGFDRVMLDNFTPQLTREAVGIIDGQFEVESSGGITLETIVLYAEAGVDFISVGALTHSVKSLDLSLKIQK